MVVCFPNKTLLGLPGLLCVNSTSFRFFEERPEWVEKLKGWWKNRDVLLPVILP